jgi:hypothetical protein
MQSKDSTYHAQPEEAFNSPPAALAADFSFTETKPPPDPDFKETGGRFRKGFDPRRHVFTREECSRGFWTAISIWGVTIGDKLHAAGRWPNYRRV